MDYQESAIESNGVLRVEEFKAYNAENKNFIQLNRSKETDELMKDSNCFMLLTQIAIRAKRTDEFNVNNLTIGEALIGDYWNIGLTEQKYRTAKAKLEKWGIITIKSTNRGTIAKLISSSIYNINIHSNNEQVTNKQRTDNEQITTNNKVNKEKKEKNKEGSRKLKFSFPGCLPEKLNNPEFIENYQLWLDDRKARNKKVTEIAISQQLEMLSKQPDAIACIKQSIQNGWTGIFPYRADANKGNGVTAKRELKMVW